MGKCFQSSYLNKVTRDEPLWCSHDAVLCMSCTPGSETLIAMQICSKKSFDPHFSWPCMEKSRNTIGIGGVQTKRIFFPEMTEAPARQSPNSLIVWVKSCFRWTVTWSARWVLPEHRELFLWSNPLLVRSTWIGQRISEVLTERSSR